MPVLDRARERELLNRVAKMSGDEMKTYTRLLYSTVLNLSRSYQHSFLDNTSVLTEKYCRRPQIPPMFSRLKPLSRVRV